MYAKRRLWNSASPLLPAGVFLRRRTPRSTLLLATLTRHPPLVYTSKRQARCGSNLRARYTPGSRRIRLIHNLQGSGIREGREYGRSYAPALSPPSLPSWSARFSTSLLSALTRSPTYISFTFILHLAHSRAETFYQSHYYASRDVTFPFFRGFRGVQSARLYQSTEWFLPVAPCFPLPISSVYSYFNEFCTRCAVGIFILRILHCFSYRVTALSFFPSLLSLLFYYSGIFIIAQFLQTVGLPLIPLTVLDFVSSAVRSFFVGLFLRDCEGSYFFP